MPACFLSLARSSIPCTQIQREICRHKFFECVKCFHGARAPLPRIQGAGEHCRRRRRKEKRRRGGRGEAAGRSSNKGKRESVQRSIVWPTLFVAYLPRSAFRIVGFCLSVAVCTLLLLGRLDMPREVLANQGTRSATNDWQTVCVCVGVRRNPAAVSARAARAGQHPLPLPIVQSHWMRRTRGRQLSLCSRSRRPDWAALEHDLWQKKDGQSRARTSKPLGGVEGERLRRSAREGPMRLGRGDLANGRPPPTHLLQTIPVGAGRASSLRQYCRSSATELAARSRCNSLKETHNSLPLTLHSHLSRFVLCSCIELASEHVSHLHAVAFNRL